MRYNPELVCLCAEVTRQQIQDHLEKNDLTSLYTHGMSQYCGSCRDEINEIIKETNSSERQ